MDTKKHTPNETRQVVQREVILDLIRWSKAVGLSLVDALKEDYKWVGLTDWFFTFDAQVAAASRGDKAAAEWVNAQPAVKKLYYALYWAQHHGVQFDIIASFHHHVSAAKRRRKAEEAAEFIAAVEGLPSQGNVNREKVVRQRPQQDDWR